MIGGLILAVGLFFGIGAIPFFSLIPLSVLGVLLAIVSVYHVILIRDINTKRQMAVVGAVAITTIILDNMVFGFGAGILLHHILRLDVSKFRSQLIVR
jgi:hypothetical protein